MKEHQKISKRANPLAPDPLVKEYGADAVRLYLMFLGPWDQGGDWSDSGMNGIRRWLLRIWDLVHKDISVLNDNVEEHIEKNFVRISHLTTKKVISDMKAFKFNTSIATLMEYSTELLRGYDNFQISKNLWKSSIERLLLHLAPLAPHIAEELWETIGNNFSIHQQSLPKYDDTLIITDTLTIVIQVNGKVRATITLPADANEDDARAVALEEPNVIRAMNGKQVRKFIYVPGRIVNVVAG